MGHTNSTANLALPQFIGTDKPTWLSDVNGAFAAIDAYAGTNDAALAITDAKADTAVNDAASAVTTATNAANTAGTASTQATNAVTVAGNALTVANGINSKVGVLTDLTTADKSSVVNAINEVNGLAKYEIKATGTANTTYASQLVELHAVYQNLTADQKRTAFLSDGNGVCSIVNVAREEFSRANVRANGMDVFTYRLDPAGAYLAEITNTNTFTDESSQVLTGSLTLYAIM